MKKIFSQKVISIFVMFAFVSVFCLPIHPAYTKIDQSEDQAKVIKSGEKAMEQTKGKVESETEGEIDEYYARDDANVIEDEGYPGKKKKKFPWLLVVGGIVVVGVALYFLVIKKPKYDLTVTVGEGVTGNPATGTTSYKKGDTVNYNYTAQSGYTDLTVKVDGADVPASGTITMDKNKSLTATATEVATLIVNSSPTGAQITLDGNDSGETTNHTFLFNTGGTHNVVLRKLGYIQYSTSKSVALGDTETINKTLTKGLREYFNTDATSSILWKWQPYTSGNWSVTGGNYVGDADVPDWNYSVYNYNWASDKYTITVRMNRSVGKTTSSNSVVLADTNSPTSVNGYLFNYTAEGWISVWRFNGRNLQTGTGGSSTAMKSWVTSSAVETGLGKYNVFKIVRNGSNYTYYLNNTLVASFSDSTYNPTYFSVLAYSGSSPTQINVDYVFADIGSTAASVPGSAVKITQTAKNERPEYHGK
jgi:hypothetical protein